MSANLDLDVARRVDELFDVERPVAERRRRFSTRRFDCLRDVGRVGDTTHAFAAAAGGGFDQGRQPDAIDRRRDAVIGLIVRRLAGDDRHASGGGEPPRLNLRSHASDGLRRRPDEDDARRRARLRKAWVLGQKPIARVNGVGAGRLGRPDDGGNRQVTLRRRRRPNRDGPIGGQCVRRSGVG